MRFVILVLYYSSFYVRSICKDIVVSHPYTWTTNKYKLVKGLW